MSNLFIAIEMKSCRRVRENARKNERERERERERKEKKKRSRSRRDIERERERIWRGWMDYLVSTKLEWLMPFEARFDWQKKHLHRVRRTLKCPTASMSSCQSKQQQKKICGSKFKCKNRKESVKEKLAKYQHDYRTIKVRLRHLISLNQDTLRYNNFLTRAWFLMSSFPLN